MQTLRVLIVLALLLAVLGSVTPMAEADQGSANEGESSLAISDLTEASDSGISLQAPQAMASQQNTGGDVLAVEYVAGESSLPVPDNGVGFDLTLPAGSSAMYPADLQPISVVQIYSSQIAGAQESATPTKVEIAVEHVLDSVSQDQWRAMRDYFNAMFGSTIVKSQGTVVAGQPAVFREIAAEDALLWETEVWVGHTAYIIAGKHSPEMEALYQAVLAGLSFTGSELLPVNELAPLDVLAAGQTPLTAELKGPDAQPNLKFPFDGTKTITCAYYADNSACHSLTKIALDFNLNYEAVRAAHSGTLSRPSYHSDYGNWIRLTDRTDPAYVSVYAHLASFMGSTGNVNQGDYIARSGNTGNSTGAHLHFELQKNGARVKPEPMCGQTGFRRYQTKADCWPSSEVFASGASSLISITTQSVNLRVCASNLPGRTVYVSLWRNAAAGYPARGWLASKVASSTCVQFNDLDGAGNTFAGTTYYTNAALRTIPADLASQQKTSCYSATGRRLMCDSVRR